MYENVPNQPASFLDVLKCWYVFDSTILTPSTFGFSVGGDRRYSVGVKRGHGHLRRPLADINRVFKRQMITCCHDFFFSSVASPLSHSMEKIHAKYIELFPNATIIDLSQNPQNRPRVQLANGSLPRLCRGSRLYSISKNAELFQKEKLLVMGLPATQWAACASHIDEDRALDFNMANTSMSSVAANCMHGACIGAVLWWLVLNLECDSDVTDSD